MNCNACASTASRHFADRADGVEILQCTRCGLGVVASMPATTAQYYDDGYYSGGSYQAYEQMAEHGVGWAAALLALLMPQGSLLDIGCADGYLLDKLGPGFRKAGIEVNPKAADEAARKGVRIIGDDLLSPALLEQHRGAFDAVTAIAVFEHLLDFRGGLDAALQMIHDEGFVLFEVPLMTDKGSNAAWLQGSFEHIYYPTENSIRHVVEVALGCCLAGSEVVIRDYGSTYVGLATRSAGRMAALRASFERVLHAELAELSSEERLAAVHLRLMHAAQSTTSSVQAVAELPLAKLNVPTLARLGQVWSCDLQKLAHDEERIAAAQAATREALAAAERQIEATSIEVARADGLAIRLEQIHAQVDALRQRLNDIEQSAAWRATSLLRRIGDRSPWLARRSVQAAKLVLWTARGTLPEHLRAFRSERRQQKDVLSLEDAALKQASRVRLLTETGIVETGEVDPPEAGEWPHDRPLVSVVIPCFNYGHLVEEAIRSALEQTFTDLEVIAVEGGSSSAESRAAFEDAVDKCATPRLRVLRQQEPRRAGANRNTGISHARGKYICCLDADDRIAPTYIEKAVFQLNQGWDIVTPALRFFGSRSEVFMPEPEPTLDMLLKGNQVLTCALFRRSGWKAAGGYRDSDPSTGHLHEDWLFWVRLAAMGARVASIREPLLHYRSHEGTLSNSDAVLEHRTQKLEIRRFNGDQLTEEALDRARKLHGPPSRPPQAFKRMAPPPAIDTASPTLLLAMPYMVLGGAERLLSAIVGHLVKEGWRVIIVTSVPIDESHGDTTSWFEGFTREIFQLPRFLRPDDWKDFIDQLFSSRRIDLAWVVGSAFVYDCLPALRLRRPALKVADLLFNTVGHTANNRRYADCIDLTFVENTEVRDWLVEAGEDSDRICLVESGVDLDENTPAADPARARADYGLPATGLLVGFFGRWSDEKDPLGFVEIARRVPADLDVCFVMTGAGPLESSLRAAIAVTGLPPERFLLKGAVPDLKPYLRACDVLVLPSRLDGRPNVVMEALASGMTVVASRVGALPELFEDARHGYLLPPGDYDGFAARIAEFATQPQRLQAFKRAARAHAEQSLDVRRMLDSYEQQLARLLPY